MTVAFTPTVIGARLAAKAFQGLRVSRKIIGKEFEGDEAAELGVLSLVDHAHDATTKLFHDPHFTGSPQLVKSPSDYNSYFRIARHSGKSIKALMFPVTV